MTGPDLAALREKAERLAAIEACEWSFGDNETELMVDMTPQFRDECVEAMLAVLSLVEDMRAALTYVGEFARAHHHQQPAHVLLHSLTIDIPEVVERALAGSPAANEEQQ